MHGETKPCESEDRLQEEGYDPETCEEPWTLIDALYFCMVTMSTVGYGDMSPSAPGSRLFTVIYILIGIIAIFSELARVLSHYLHMLEGHIRQVVSLVVVGSDERDGVDCNGDGKVDIKLPPTPFVFWTTSLTPSISVLVLFQCLSAAIYMFSQEDLLYSDALYHCMVTATTVGYGDVKLTTQTARLWAFLHIAFSVALLAATVSQIKSLMKIRAISLKEVALLQRSLDVEWIETLDTDGDGVDKLEFIVGMLIQLDARLCHAPITWDTLRPWMEQFDAADVDGSGKLDKKDIKSMVLQRRRSLGTKALEEIESFSGGTDRSGRSPRGSPRRHYPEDRLFAPTFQAWSGSRENSPRRAATVAPEVDCKIVDVGLGTITPRAPGPPPPDPFEHPAQLKISET